MKFHAEGAPGRSLGSRVNGPLLFLLPYLLSLLSINPTSRIPALIVAAWMQILAAAAAAATKPKGRIYTTGAKFVRSR